MTSGTSVKSVYRIGIDLGGTKIEGIALDASGQEARRVRIAAPRGDYRQTLDAIASVVAELKPAPRAGPRLVSVFPARCHPRPGA